MAFTITNKQFANPEATFLPVCHSEIADATLATASSTVTGTTVNTGVVGLKWVRVRVHLKTLGGLAAGETLVCTVQAGTGADRAQVRHDVDRRYVHQHGPPGLLPKRVPVLRSHAVVVRHIADERDRLHGRLRLSRARRGGGSTVHNRSSVGSIVTGAHRAENE